MGEKCKDKKNLQIWAENLIAFNNGPSDFTDETTINIKPAYISNVRVIDEARKWIHSSAEIFKTIFLLEFLYRILFYEFLLIELMIFH